MGVELKGGGALKEQEAKGVRGLITTHQPSPSPPMLCPSPPLVGGPRACGLETVGRRMLKNVSYTSHAQSPHRLLLGPQTSVPLCLPQLSLLQCLSLSFCIPFYLSLSCFYVSFCLSLSLSPSVWISLCLFLSVCVSVYFCLHICLSRSLDLSVFFSFSPTSSLYPTFSLSPSLCHFP